MCVAVDRWSDEKRSNRTTRRIVGCVFLCVFASNFVDAVTKRAEGEGAS